MTTYRYETVVRDTENDPVYTYAEVKYGRIVAINNHWTPLEEYKKFYEPNVMLLDITGMIIDGQTPQVGDLISGAEGGYTITHMVIDCTDTSAKPLVIEKLKLVRDQKELEPIAYNDVLFDADRVSQERMDKARKFLEDNNIPFITWTAADNRRVDLTVNDFKGINSAIAIRSNELHIRYNVLKQYINELADEHLMILSGMDWDWDITQDKDEAVIRLSA